MIGMTPIGATVGGPASSTGMVVVVVSGCPVGATMMKNVPFMVLLVVAVAMAMAELDMAAVVVAVMVPAVALTTE